MFSETVRGAHCGAEVVLERSIGVTGMQAAPELAAVFMEPHLCLKDGLKSQLWFFRIGYLADNFLGK